MDAETPTLWRNKYRSHMSGDFYTGTTWASKDEAEARAAGLLTWNDGEWAERLTYLGAFKA